MALRCASMTNYWLTFTKAHDRLAERLAVLVSYDHLQGGASCPAYGLHEDGPRALINILPLVRRAVVADIGPCCQAAITQAQNSETRSTTVGIFTRAHYAALNRPPELLLP